MSSTQVASEPQIINNASEVYVLSDFVRAGTTASIKAAYAEAKSKGLSKRKLPNNRLAELKEVLQHVKWRKHKQKKIAEVESGVELCDATNCYCLILAQEQLIDVSGSVECDLTAAEIASLRKLLEP